MNWLEKTITAVSPKWAYGRLAWKMAVEEARRAYDAGDHSRLNSGWNAVNDSAERTDRYERDTIRARARDLERNSDIMNAVVTPYKRNTVGSGYHLEAVTKNSELNDAIEDLWEQWCLPRNCDVTNTQSLNQILRMAVVRKRVDGGILFAKRYTRYGILPFQLQMFEVDELDNDVMAPKKSGNRVVGGIEYNSFNRPEGYWIKQYDIDGWTMTQPIYIDAKDIIFYYTKHRPSQIREMSDMTQTIPRIRDTNEFINAVSVKQRIEACLSVFIKRTFPQSGVGRGTGGTGNQKSYDGKLLTPGMIRELNAGDDVVAVNPLGQAADATSFVKLQQHMISSGQGISYEAMSRDMSESTYSSARQGIIEDDLTYDEEEEAILAILNEIYETFIISAVLAGELDIPDFWENKRKYFLHSWTKAPKRWIDPQKETKATQTALATGQKTFKQIAAENGRDWKDQVNDIVEVLTYGDEKGIDLRPIIFGQAPAAEESTSEEGEKDGESE